jgi:hypothetical protein
MVTFLERWRDFKCSLQKAFRLENADLMAGQNVKRALFIVQFLGTLLIFRAEVLTRSCRCVMKAKEGAVLSGIKHTLCLYLQLCRKRKSMLLLEPVAYDEQDISVG